MIFSTQYYNDLHTKISISSFSTKESVTEYHAMCEYTQLSDSDLTQFKHIQMALERWLNELPNAQCVFRRYFLSDAVNQQQFIRNDISGAVSIVQQPPLNGSKVSLWIYAVDNVELEVQEKTAIMSRPNYQHFFTTQLHKPLKDAGEETRQLFEEYVQFLEKNDCTLKDNCIRTWIFVQGVDIHYADMVTARTKCFDRENLTADTHYLASTGIEGRYALPRSLVLIDAYAVKGIMPEQIRHLSALTHLNPTYEYGVTFERATAVYYADRYHIYISGTASIDNKGEIVHPHNIRLQTLRTIENINALLAEAESTTDDIAQMIVYLRDTADFNIVSEYLEAHYPHFPKCFVWAPVCRPGWLIEIECIAIKTTHRPEFKPF